MQRGGNGSASAGVGSVQGLVGRPFAIAAQEIARALAPEGIDADRVAVALNEAMTEVMAEEEIFDPGNMSADQIVEVLIDYLARILFQQVTEDAGSAWNRSPSEARTIEAENELFDLIKIAMDQHLGPKLANGVGRMSKTDVERAQLRAMQDVWREWEFLRMTRVICHAAAENLPFSVPAKRLTCMSSCTEGARCHSASLE